MATVIGIGGVFFRSRDPQELSAWYRRSLGVQFDRGAAMFAAATMPPGGYTVWSPFPASTAYSDPSAKEFMINLVVDNLDEALAQVREGGAEIVGGIETHDDGWFGWFLDPERNKVELWEPRGGPPGE